MAKTARQDPICEQIDEHALGLNETFGELGENGKVKSPDDYVTDPVELSEFARPSDEAIKDLVKRGAAALRRRQA